MEEFRALSRLGNDVRHKVADAGFAADPAVAGNMHIVHFFIQVLGAMIQQLDATLCFVAGTTAEQRVAAMAEAGCRVDGPGLEVHDGGQG